MKICNFAQDAQYTLNLIKIANTMTVIVILFILRPMRDTHSFAFRHETSLLSLTIWNLVSSHRVEFGCVLAHFVGIKPH